MKKLIVLVIIIVSGLIATGQHVVVLKTGQRVEGVVMELKYDTLLMVVDFKEKRLHLKNISSIFFNEYKAYDGSLLKNEEYKTIQAGEYTIRYQMKDRTIEKAPIISIGTEDKGTVVVEVEIDRYGNVLQATPGVTGSNTSNKYLLTKAKYAAQGTKFSKHPTGPVRTKGVIIITY